MINNSYLIIFIIINLFFLFKFDLYSKFFTIVDKPNEYAWNKLLEGQYNQLRLQFLGSDNQPLKILDPDTVIVMLIREKS